MAKLNNIQNSKLKNFLYGLFLPIKAAGILRRNPRLIPYAILPFVINLLVFVVVVFVTFHWVIPAINIEEYSPQWAGVVGKWLLSIIEFVLLLGMLLTFFYFGFTTIGMVLASPFNDLLSEKIEEMLTKNIGQEKTFNLWLKITLHSLIESLKIAGKQILFMILALPFLFIPIVGFIPMFVVSAYFTGLGFFDIALARHFIKSEIRKREIKKIKWQLFGLGVVMELSLLVPILGLFVFPLGAIAATVMFCNMDWEEIGNVRRLI